MKYIELKEFGSSCTMKMQKIERRKSKFGEDYALIGNVEHGEQASVSVPEKAMERQMDKTLKISDVDDLKGRFVTISRSDEAGANGKAYWNVVWADEETYQAPAKAPEESKRVQPPPDTRTAGQKAFDEAVPPEPKAPAPVKESAAPLQGELRGQDEDPAVHAAEADRIADAVEAKKRAGMVAIRTKYRALWESEAEFQILAVMRVREKIAKERQLALDDVPQIVIDGSSVNAESATLWINFDRRNYV